MERIQSAKTAKINTLENFPLVMPLGETALKCTALLK